MIEKIKKIKRKKVLKKLYVEYKELSDRSIDFKEFCEEFNLNKQGFPNLNEVGCGRNCYFF